MECFRRKRSWCMIQVPRRPPRRWTIVWHAERLTRRGLLFGVNFISESILQSFWSGCHCVCQSVGFLAAVDILFQIVLIQFIHGIRPLAFADHGRIYQCNYGVRNAMVIRWCETRHLTKMEMARERWRGVRFGEDLLGNRTMDHTGSFEGPNAGPYAGIKICFR